MSIRKSVVALLPGRTEGADDSPPGNEGDTEDTAETDAAGLYNCSDCGTTYISEAMDTCPDCDTTVESVPTESDLNML